MPRIQLMPLRLVTLSILLVLASGFVLVSAQEETTPSNGNALRYHDIQGDVRALQQLLAVSGHYVGAPTGTWDEPTRSALRDFQRAHRLPVTGELDVTTVAALGGSPDHLNMRPRFWYTVRGGDALSVIANRFGSFVPWIVRLNPEITSIHHIVTGTDIVIPIQFPLPGGVQVERLQILGDRFLGTYTSTVAFTEVNQLVNWFGEALQATGFQVEIEENPLDGITLRERGVVLGRIAFSAQQSDGLAQMHVALLFKRHEDLEEDLQGDDWVPVPD